MATKDNVLVGVVSFGIPCAKGYPDGFNRVFNHLDFVYEAIGQTPQPANE